MTTHVRISSVDDPEATETVKLLPGQTAEEAFELWCVEAAEWEEAGTTADDVASLHVWHGVTQPTPPTRTV